jgi:circadian clock protein KaiB
MKRRRIPRGNGKPKPDADKPANGKYLLRLYVSGVTPRSTRAILNLKEICEHRLARRYTLEVIDIYQQPERVKSEQIIAAPTLIKHLPLPVRRFIGDMSKTERILVGLSVPPSAEANETDDQNDGHVPHTPRF